jgi:hypothetical protein
MTSSPPMEIELGVMSPTAFSATPARIAYGTLSRGCLGLISSLLPTVIPKYRVEPSKISGSIGVSLPRRTEK